MATIATALECSGTEARPLAKGLGWFSIGLGVAEVAAPGALAKLIGVPRNRNLIRALGLREIAAGLGILAQDRPAYWLWARVAGDVMDLALLGAALSRRRTEPARIAGAAAAVAGVAVLDLVCSRQHTNGEAGADRALRIARSITVSNSTGECYRWWRDFTHFPRVMRHVESVQSIGEGRTHWIVKGPGNQWLQWECEVNADEPDQHIAWHSVEGSDVDFTGSVHFEPAPANRGTVVRVAFHYCPPAGRLGSVFARMIGQYPEVELANDLRRFKQLLETGEIATTEGQPAGRSEGRTWLDRIAS